ncbi:MAG: AI-2E family transporter [Verrucomicrobiota bacterium]|nr:AI-2E family transporter [Verrucomicrobiota bacterium]
MLGLIILLGLGIYLLFAAVNVFLIFFTGVLLAVFLRGLTNGLKERTGWSDKLSLTLVTLSLAGLLTGLFFLLAPEIGKQTDQLSEQLPKAVEQLQEKIQSNEWGRRVIGQQPAFTDLMKQIPNALSRAGLLLSSTLGLLVNLVVVVSVGIYLASAPDVYVNGVAQLFPKPQRKRSREVMAELGITLQRWLNGRMFLMLTNGIVTWLGLLMMGVPLALTLGLIAGLLNFIPNIGPILAAIPAVLVALMEGPDKVIHVLVFYVVYQMVDGYVLTPLVEKRTVSLPPALTITAQVLMGVLLGTLGVLLATPIVAVGLVLTKMVYIQDILGQDTDLPGERHSQKKADQLQGKREPRSSV